MEVSWDWASYGLECKMRIFYRIFLHDKSLHKKGIFLLQVWILFGQTSVMVLRIASRMVQEKVYFLDTVYS